MTFVDATTASKAGLENWLLDKAETGTLAEIIVLEEIEKQPLDNLLTLVSLMGSGYVAKLNARVGHRKELANVLVWATCNDEGVADKLFLAATALPQSRPRPRDSFHETVPKEVTVYSPL